MRGGGQSPRPGMRFTGAIGKQSSRFGSWFWRRERGSRGPRCRAPLWTRGLLVASGTAAYLGVVHGVPHWWRRPGSKEAAVGVVFALGVSLAAWSMVETWTDILAIGLFCLLCWINCAAIEDWEHGSAARNSVVTGCAGVAVIAVILLRDHRPVIACAETASALGFLLIDRCARRISGRRARSGRRSVAHSDSLPPRRGHDRVNCDPIAPYYASIEFAGIRSRAGTLPFPLSAAAFRRTTRARLRRRGWSISQASSGSVPQGAR